MSDLPETLQSPLLQALSGIRHGFFTRRGGVSTDLYSSLNCAPASDDETKNVEANRQRVARKVGVAAGHLCGLRQAHTACVHEANTTTTPRGDGLVTGQPDLAVCVLSADCAPLLFASQTSQFVAAVHAGWKGALAGVTDQAIQRMTSAGAGVETLRVCIGPCIQQQSYAVGPEFEAKFVDTDTHNRQFFAYRDAQHFFDLPGYIKHRLHSAGVTMIEDLGIDTYSNPDQFFSYRRSTHEKQPDYGRQISAIAISKPHHE